MAARPRPAPGISTTLYDDMTNDYSIENVSDDDSGLYVHSNDIFDTTVTVSEYVSTPVGPEPGCIIDISADVCSTWVALISCVTFSGAGSWLLLDSDLMVLAGSLFSSWSWYK